MNELIKITEYNGIEAVSARDLHEFVEMETRFDKWIKRMLEYGFIENVDYQCLSKNVQMPNGGYRESLDDYALTLDCAKEISMIQKNEKGKQARQYFIAWEKLGRQLLKQQLKSAEDSARRRLYISNRIREIDITISGMMDERRGLVKENNKINANDFQQLSLSIFDVDYNKLPGQFPNKSKLLKIS